MISIHSKKDDSTISSEKLCHLIHEMISSSRRWILLAVSHCKIMDTVRHPLHRALQLLKEHYGLEN